jgi:hypothetical protein
VRGVSGSGSTCSIVSLMVALLDKRQASGGMHLTRSLPKRYVAKSPCKCARERAMSRAAALSCRPPFQRGTKILQGKSQPSKSWSGGGGAGHVSQRARSASHAGPRHASNGRVPISRLYTGMVKFGPETKLPPGARLSSQGVSFSQSSFQVGEQCWGVRIGQRAIPEAYVQGTVKTVTETLVTLEDGTLASGPLFHNREQVEAYIEGVVPWDAIGSSISR